MHTFIYSVLLLDYCSALLSYLPFLCNIAFIHVCDWSDDWQQCLKSAVKEKQNILITCIFADLITKLSCVKYEHQQTDCTSSIWHKIRKSIRGPLYGPLQFKFWVILCNNLEQKKKNIPSCPTRHPKPRVEELWYTGMMGDDDRMKQEVLINEVMGIWF